MSVRRVLFHLICMVCCTATLSLAAVPPVPKISSAPASVNLGTVKVGSVSAAKSVTIKNTGKSDLILGALTISGANQTEFLQTNDCGTLLPGGSCPVNVTFAPALPFGNKSASLVIPSNDPSKPSVTIKLSGTAPPPVISATPGSLNFGKITAGSASAAKKITIGNKGTSDLQVASVTVSGVNASEFGAAGSCGAIPKGGSCTIDVTFYPQAPVGTKTASLVILSNDPKKPAVSLKLSGTSSSPPGNGKIVLVTVNPLPDVTVGQTPSYLQTVVSNITPPSPPSIYTYSIDTLAVGNGVPTGMTLNMAGVLSGTPFATGAADVNGYQIPHLYTFGVCATDTLSRTETTPCPQTTITVLPLNLTVTVAGTGSGTVTPSPAGNSCGENCYEGFASGSSVTLTANPAAGSTFTGWSACPGTGPCVVKMSTSQAVTATFNQAATCSNGASDWPTCTLSSVNPASVTVGTAGGCSGGMVTGTFQVTAASNVSWTAVGDTPAVGGGTVNVSPKSGSGSGTFTVTITVVPQLPSSSYSNCSLTYKLGTLDNVYVTFSDGTVVGVTVYWTFIGVT